MKLIVSTILALCAVLSFAQCPFDMITGDVTSKDAFIQASLNDVKCRKNPSSRYAFARVKVSQSREFRKLILDKVITTDSKQGADPRDSPGYYIARVNVKNLRPATRYYYQFFDEHGKPSPVGIINTLPKKSSTDEVHFVQISCANRNPFPISSSLRDYIKSENPQFTVFNGDLVYADRVWLPQDGTTDNVNRCCRQPNMTMDYYVGLYSDQRDDVFTGDGFGEALYSNPIFNVWDDHEIIDNAVGDRGNPDLAFADPFAGTRTPMTSFMSRRFTKLGRDAFFTMNPMASAARLNREDPAKVALPRRRIFRKFRVGKDVEIFVLDLRTYREPINYPRTNLPVKPENVSDNHYCGEDGGVLAPQICNEIPTPDYQPEYRQGKRTLLGPGQKRWLKNSLKNSKAKFKLIVSSVMILEFFYDPADRWEGYWSDRKEVLDFIQDNMIKNVVFLTGDYHCSIYGRVNPGIEPPIYEVTTGSIGSLTRRADFVNWFFTYASQAHLVPGSAASLMYLEGANFMVVKVKKGKLTIQTRGTKGQIVTDSRGNRGELVLG